jgi:hypothetical protein
MVAKTERSNGFMGVLQFGSSLASLAQDYWQLSSRRAPKVVAGVAAAAGAASILSAMSSRVSAAADSAFGMLTGVLWTMAAVGALEIYRRYSKESSATAPVIVNLHFNGVNGAAFASSPVQSACEVP